MLLGTAAALLALTALLSVPVDFIFVLRRHDAFQGSVYFGWLFGLIRLPMPSSRAARKPRPPKKPRKKRRFPRRALRALGNAEFLRRCLSFLAGLLRSVRVHKLAMRLRWGLEDPADTGRLWGFLAPLVSVLRLSRRANLDVDLDFTDACFEVDAEGTIRIIPAQVVWLSVLFLLSPATLRAAWTLTASRKR